MPNPNPLVEAWHRYVESADTALLEAQLADDVVFYSPIVFTPQKGKDVTMLYLGAAASSLGGEGDAKFRYTKEIVADDQAMLEFETSVEGKYVNGVDIITWNEQGKIIEFKVMIRPLQAVNAVHKQMMEMIARMRGE